MPPQQEEQQLQQAQARHSSSAEWHASAIARGAAGVDLSGDGAIDAVALDTSGDGQLDALVPVRTRSGFL